MTEQTTSAESEEAGPPGLPDPDIRQVIDRVAEVERRLREAQGEIETLRSRLAQAEQEATTDSLTGIPNRRGFLGLLCEAARAADGAGTPLSLLMVDVDRFKAFNDRFGHHVGDHVLRLVAHSLAEIPAERLNGPAVVGRYGGEEFAVLLQGVDAGKALTLADALREDLAARQFIMRGTGESLAQITISIGLAERRAGEDPAEALRRADTALYDAKRLGRNRVQVLAPAPAES